MKTYNLNGGSAIVVGGAGYIGSHVCKALTGQGISPLVFDNFSSGHKHAVKWGDYIDVDLRDRRAIFQACEAHKAIKTIIHLASSIEVEEGEKNPAFFYENNVLGALNLLDAMQAAGQSRLIFSSTCATYGELDTMPLKEDMVQNPFSVYGKTKLAIEHMIQSYHKSYGLNYVTLRYFNASGADPDGEIGEEHHPETHLIPNVFKAALGLGQGLKIFGTDYDTPDGTCVRDYIHVNDIAAAHLDSMCAFDKGLTGTEVNIGTGIGISVLEIIKMIEAVTGLKVPYEAGPRRDGDLTQLYADASKAKTLLGFTPHYSDLEKIIETAWTFHRKTWNIS